MNVTKNYILYYKIRDVLYKLLGIFSEGALLQSVFLFKQVFTVNCFYTHQKKSELRICYRSFSHRDRRPCTEDPLNHYWNNLRRSANLYSLLRSWDTPRSHHTVKGYLNHKALGQGTIGIRKKALSQKKIRKTPNIHMLSLTEFWRSVTACILFTKIA